jgi:hypothetical protein
LIVTVTAPTLLLGLVKMVTLVLVGVRVVSPLPEVVWPAWPRLLIDACSAVSCVDIPPTEVCRLERELPRLANPAEVEAESVEKSVVIVVVRPVTLPCSPVRPDWTVATMLVRLVSDDWIPFSDDATPAKSLVTVPVRVVRPFWTSETEFWSA